MFPVKLWGSIRWVCFQMVSLCQCLFGVRTRKSDPEQTQCLCCQGLHSHRRSSHLCLSRLDGHRFALCILAHKQTSTLIPHNRLASCRIWYSSFRVPTSSVPSFCGMIGRRRRSARCCGDPNVICPHLFCLIRLPQLVQLTRCCGQSTCNTHTHTLVAPIIVRYVVTTRQCALNPMFIPIGVPTFWSEISDNPTACSGSKSCPNFL